MSGELEKPEDANDWEELEDVGVLEVRGQLLQDQVNVEAQCGDVVDDVDTEIKVKKLGHLIGNAFFSTVSRHSSLTVSIGK